MIYFENFKNNKEFNQIFGITEHGNGVKSRKNKILLECLKNRELHKWWLSTGRAILRGNTKQWDKSDLLTVVNMDGLKQVAKFLLMIMWTGDDDMRPLAFADEFPYNLWSKTYRLDAYKGLCTDGDTKAIRYVNTERDNKAFKMKAGKFISKCIEESFLRDIMPEQMKRWIGEEFAREWQSYAEQHSDSKYTLHVDDNFEDIYDSSRCFGNFGSCMTDRGCHNFYRDSINCKAAYLTNADDEIVARCIVYQDVTDGNGNHYRLAERQYASSQEDVLKQLLVDMLIKAGEIDGYKRVGADCHDNKNFVRNDGTSMRDLNLRIDCNLEPGDPLSYQDSFVYYSIDRNVAYNDRGFGYDYELNTTDGTFEPSGNYSEYYDCYIDEYESCYDEYYEDYFYSCDAAHAIYNGRLININRERANEEDEIWCWSEEENAFIYYGECCYVEKHSGYFLSTDCVYDINGDYQLSNDCEYSDYLGEYILSEDTVWSEDLDSYIPESEAVWCKVDRDYTYKGLEEFSEITGYNYCSEESMLEDEALFRKEHALVVLTA